MAAPDLILFDDTVFAHLAHRPEQPVSVIEVCLQCKGQVVRLAHRDCIGWYMFPIRYCLNEGKFVTAMGEQETACRTDGKRLPHLAPDEILRLPKHTECAA